MKKTLSLIIAVAFSFSIYAQAPQSFAYQGIARNNIGNPISNQLISIRASILDGSSTGTSQYTETQSVTTNSLGLFSISIGTGVVQTGTFSAITWATNLKFMKVEFDPAGGTSYILSGTQQILSVPYALNALNVKNYVAGSGVSVSGSTITNTAPNQTVTLTGTGSTSVTGTYPNYTVNTDLSPCLPKFITNVSLVNVSANNNSSLTYSSLDCSAYIPVGATHVILNIVASSSYFYINFKKDNLSQSLYTLSGNSNAIGMILVSGLNYENSHVIVPVDALRKFQYLFTNNGLASTGNLKIDLIGYY